MATQYGLDGDSEGTEEARVFIDTREPVSIETLGNFLEVLGRETQIALGDDEVVVELVDFRQGSLDFFFRKRRLRAEELEERKQRIEREIRMLELAEEADKRGQRNERRSKRIELIAAVTLALSVPGCAKTAHTLLTEGNGTAITVEQADHTPRKIGFEDLRVAYEITAVPERYVRESITTLKPPIPTREERIDMLRDYEDGQCIDIAGRLMPRKKGFFQTVKRTQLPLVEIPDNLEPRQLVTAHARVSKSGEVVGIVILDFKPLDDP